MAHQTYGLSSLTFGTPTVTGYVIQSHTVSTKPAVIVEVIDEAGNRVHSRYGDITNELSVTALLNGATVPIPGATFAIDSVTYEVLSVDVKRENKGYKTVDIKGKKSENLSLS